MSCQIEESFLKLCDESSCILVFNLDFKPKDTILTLDMSLNIEDFENRYWGRLCDEGYCYKVRRF